ERFLDRRPVGLARHAQRAAHRRSDELAPSPAGALAAASERRNGDVHERGVPRFEPLARDASILKARKARRLDEEIRAGDMLGVVRLLGKPPAERLEQAA